MTQCLQCLAPLPLETPRAISASPAWVSGYRVSYIISLQYRAVIGWVRFIVLTLLIMWDLLKRLPQLKSNICPYKWSKWIYVLVNNADLRPSESSIVISCVNLLELKDSSGQWYCPEMCQKTWSPAYAVMTESKCYPHHIPHTIDPLVWIKETSSTNSSIPAYKSDRLHGENTICIPGDELR